MYFLNMLYNIITRFLTSFTHVFHKKRKGQVVQKSASSRIRLWWKRLNENVPSSHPILWFGTILTQKSNNKNY